VTLCIGLERPHLAYENIAARADVLGDLSEI
jgi:hypothetical protein